MLCRDPQGWIAHYLYHRAKFSVVTPLADCTTPALMDERAILRAAQITLRRAICERFPPGRERRVWLSWLRELVACAERADGAASVNELALLPPHSNILRIAVRAGKFH